MQSEQPEQAQVQRFGTFVGVFRPTTLTILGAMFYLREGWLVGREGLGGALVVILAATSITGLTTLSLSSIATNTRVRPGGAFAIISQALGLEAGGAIGVPLWIAQTLSAAMYLYAFSEAWRHMFPGAPGALVATLGFLGVAFVAWRSAELAFRAQAAMLVVVALAVLSAFLGVLTVPQLHSPVWVGELGGHALADAFSVFFPAATGIMVGVGMSGQLEDPRRSIPRGTLWAWGATLGVYVVGAFWYAVVASPAELVEHPTIMMDRALVGPVVLIGLLGSTLMAALSSLVAAPRLLAAMASHGVVPWARWLAVEPVPGEPRNAVVATTAVAGLGLLAGSLDAIAPIITSFFIMTYLSINLVVFVEQGLGMVSWRPSFRLPRLTPLIGVGACLVGLELGSPFGGVVEVVLVVGIYGVLSRRKLETPWETVRSGVLVSLGAWAARRVANVQRTERAWKPDLLVPVSSPEQAERMGPLVVALAARNGSVRWVGLGPHPQLRPTMPEYAQRLLARGISASSTVLETDQYMHGISLALDALNAALFPPNLVVVDATRINQSDLDAYMVLCRRVQVGLVLWFPAPGDEPLGQRRRVAVWLSDRSPSWELRLRLANLDLPILTGWLLSSAWQGQLCLHTVVADESNRAPAEHFLRDLVDQARLSEAEGVVDSGDFKAALDAGTADIHLFGMAPQPSLERMVDLAARTRQSCIFLLDSGRESALA